MAKFDEHPFIAIWETTQACDLACQHCRACAKPGRDPRELDTAEGKRLLDSFAGAHVPLVILTGGDPAKRPDLLELVAYGRSRGLLMGLTPSATPLVTTELIAELAQAGLSRLAVSVDAPTAAVHDAFRGVTGSFELSLRILRDAKAHGIGTQINTSIHAGNIHILPEMARLVRDTGCVLWSVFFVVPTGRAGLRMLPSDAAVESALEELASIAEREDFAIKTTAAPHYRRVLAQRKKATGTAADYGTHGKLGLRVNDGRGFLFVSHRGEVFPSGFLPIPCGNVRKQDVIDIYRTSPVFQALRDADRLKGKCGACEYARVCGGSRARAFAVTGDYLDWDGLCSYVPPGYQGDFAEDQRARRALLGTTLSVVNG
ncbi:MAG: radical SAM protein [Polyangiaceae bacterium]|nr:radical SAM protein [Polyangiaceae bacterium]MCE7891186.1 radical SAM protein [Sorangiineae bacterium PRO1]MCL4754182.1 radical SAM protein [Myxococcales bacterium]